MMLDQASVPIDKTGLNLQVILHIKDAADYLDLTEEEVIHLTNIGELIPILTIRGLFYFHREALSNLKNKRHSSIELARDVSKVLAETEKPKKDGVDHEAEKIIKFTRH